MSIQGETQYFCELCKHSRLFKIDEETHRKNIDQHQSGLALYSDIHPCKDGITGVNNLRIDANYAIRSFENQELPPVRVASKFAIPGIPSASKSTTNFTNLYVSSLHPKISFRLIIFDEWLVTKIIIGDINEDEEIPIGSVHSDLGGITLSFYNSDLNYTPALEQWFSVFANSLELLPPTRFGLVIETIKYVLGLHDTTPSSFDIKLLKTMLASHEIYFKATNDPNRFDTIAVELSSKYAEREVSIMMKLLAHLELNPAVPLQYYIKTHHHDLEYLIYLFLILENDGLVVVDRPGIIDM
jgi:hypothetical protein